ncbi:Uridine phosphorylase [Mycena sanguinolenta]|uniref:Uridine phosphorylase n=1 Tax=Mycena sanguinolenta TaxID=230812 RepID=A0A8H6ZIM1_9AGAR|nr:Uridine phosphorylase [Mycena sanguinolenta]
MMSHIFPVPPTYVTVGSGSRSRTVASHFDAAPKLFELVSERGFQILTGRGVSVSVASIGTGHPNVEFFVREVRECLSGDMLIVRLGFCGSLIDVPVGSVMVPKSSAATERNLDLTSPSTASAIPRVLAGHDTVIRAAAAHLVFASRTSQDFITPSEVAVLKEWTAKVCLSFGLSGTFP